mgnify:CR=1 FL=1
MEKMLTQYFRCDIVDRQDEYEVFFLCNSVLPVEGHPVRAVPERYERVRAILHMIRTIYI